MSSNQLEILCFKGFLGRKHSKKFGGSSRKLSEAKMTCFGANIVILRAFSQRNGYFQASRFNFPTIKDRSLRSSNNKDRSLYNKDRSLNIQKLKKARFPYWNLLYTTKARYKHLFLLCIIVHIDFNMNTCDNNVNLCWFGEPYLRNNNYGKRLSLKAWSYPRFLWFPIGVNV